MRTFTFLVIATTLTTSVIVSQAGGPPPDNPPKKLQAFASDQELKSYLSKLIEEQRRQRRNKAGVGGGVAETVAAPAAAADATESVTNVQHAGVDEGGIVKLHGDHLVVLRRGRLFTIGVGKGELRAISNIDAFAPDIEPKGTWYDEMLVAGDTIVVIGYSYARGGTELGLFSIDRAGNLRYRSTYHLRSNDYYSSRNYSSRLIGTKLVFYAPLYVSFNSVDPFDALPALRRWHTGATAGEFQRIVTAPRVYRPVRPLDGSASVAMHTVTVCDLARADLVCEATVVMGPPGRVFYVSPQSVYVWATEWFSGARTRPTLYRLPLDGSQPSALQVSGSPVDQFSFLESDDHHLNVLVRSNTAGDGMWAAEVGSGDVALLRIPLDTFSDGRDAVPAYRYRPLPKPPGYTFQNRFVQDYLLYGTGSGWGRAQTAQRSTLYAVRWTGGEVFTVPLQHGVDRIEAMGPDAVVVGTDGRDLHFSAVSLGAQAHLVDRYTRADASQGELRSHGFFYKPETRGGGLLGLPVRRGGRPGFEHLFQGSAAILFLRNDALRFSEIGELAAEPERARDDKCRASCVDWYGNARPLFIGKRVLALLGYEIVEGKFEDERLQELRRITYAP